MSYTYTYLLPLNPEPEPVEYGRRVKEFLVSQEVITEETDEFGMFGLGERALSPFELLENWDQGFDFGDIFSGPHLTIVPVEDQPLEPRCPTCEADLGAELNRLYCPDETTSVEKIDFTGLTITCPRCGGVSRPDQLIDRGGNGIFLTRRYVCFVSAGKFRREWLAEFEKAAGTPHWLVTYWCT